MTIQLVYISFEDVFKRYSKKYNIFRDLYEKDQFGLEIRDLPKHLEDFVRKTVLGNNEICYTAKTKKDETVDFLALGSLGIFKEIARGIVSTGNEDVGYKISNVIRNFTEYELKSFTVDKNNYSMKDSYVMGILNITPDSFSDGGKFLEHENAIKHALAMIDQGADFIDIGGESTRPGAEPVSADDEIHRVVPVIESVLKEKPETIISIDTTKSAVAHAALSKGAKIVNDISGFTFDPDMLKTVKKFNAGLVIMHIQGKPATMQEDPYYDDVVNEVYTFLNDKVQEAKRAGIKTVFIDPGIGFGKRVNDNYELLKRLKEFKSIGCPLLVGLSNKSFLGKALDLEIDKREKPTLVAETIAIKNGAKIIRTHNVKNAVMANKIIRFVENPEVLINV